ncbi:MAG TPA: metallophosphoesterase [Acidimicrobiales bacterium]|nr:metallophosphoesterase [Acidimicrobiales bacterium]
MLAAGDIADCSSAGDEATAALLDARPAGVVATLGDNVYDSGTPREFAECYAPTWGRHKDRTRPAPGNHDYDTTHAAGYFGYFGAAAGDPTKGYYSYDLGAWHVIVLNSNCPSTSCEVGGSQERWLRTDLAASGASCTLAYWHHPPFSSGSTHGSDDAVAPLFRALYEAGAELVLAGHEHNYERFAPLAPSGKVDPARGIRTFVVGTGGRSLYGFGSPHPGSEARNRDAFGILALDLEAGGYRWEFVPQAGKTFTDSGSGTCH